MAAVRCRSLFEMTYFAWRGRLLLVGIAEASFSVGSRKTTVIVV
jgi:hypothetical protein